VDTETEALIQTAIEALISQQTSIVIAHRLSTIRNADRILVLQSGAIIERGTHAELMSRGGHYEKLHRSSAL
jgi:ATP-binding cassette subfamily B protein